MTEVGGVRGPEARTREARRWRRPPRAQASGKARLGVIRDAQGGLKRGGVGARQLVHHQELRRQRGPLRWRT